LYDFQTSIRTKNAPRLFVDPFECIGAYVSTCAVFYENEVIDALKLFLRESASMSLFYVDIGANIGNHLVAFREHYEDFVGFEPNPVNYKLCQANLMYNGLDPNNLHQIAVGSSDQENVLLSFPDNGTWAGSHKRNNGLFKVTFHDNKHNFKSIRVPMRKVDFFLDKAACYSTILVKIDVEGHELDVIKGMSSFISSSIHCDILVAFELLTSEQQSCIYLYLQSLRHCETYVHQLARFARVVNLLKAPVPSTLVLIKFPKFTND
jgi:FkbM family methyltransferase